jgi:hypothetical protein
MNLSPSDIKEATPSPEPLPQKTDKASMFFLPVDYEELRLFALLKWRFGSPNGPITFCGRPGGDPDGPFKWDFLFVPGENLKLQVLRTTKGIELRWWGQKTDKSSILKYFDYNIKKYKSEIEDEIKKLELYTLILNPYVRHRSIAEHTLEELNSIKIKIPLPPRKIKIIKGGLEKYNKRFKKYFGLVQQQASLNLLLVMESAFMAEAYLNLILAVFLKNEIRNSKNLQEEVLLKKWRSKIERLQIDCHYIKRKPNLGDSRIRDAKRLFDLRNQLAHSYPDKKNLKLGNMWFYQSFPVLPNAVHFQDFAIALINQLPSIEEAKFCIKAARGLIEFLNELIDERYLESFKGFAEANPLGFNETKQIYGVPFGNVLIDAFFI